MNTVRPKWGRMLYVFKTVKSTLSSNYVRIKTASINDMSIESSSVFTTLNNICIEHSKLRSEYSWIMFVLETVNCTWSFNYVWTENSLHFSVRTIPKLWTLSIKLCLCLMYCLPNCVLEKLLNNFFHDHKISIQYLTLYQTS